MMYRKSLETQNGGKITSEKDAGAHLFNRDILKQTEMVVVCEGWGDVIAFWDHGINAVASIVGAGHWNREWNQDLANVKRVYVTGDADDAGARMIQMVRKEIPWASVLQPLFNHGSKGDGRDYFKRVSGIISVFCANSFSKARGIV